MNEHLKRFWLTVLKMSVNYGIILLVSAIHVAMGILSIEKTGKTLWQVIVGGVVIFLIGMVINRAFERQGMTEGDGDERVKEAVSTHAETVDRVIPYIDRLEDWCDRKNREALRTRRARILAERGMKYTDYFDEEGMTREFCVNEAHLKNRYMRKIEVRRIRCYYKALSVKLTALTASELTSEGGRNWDPYYLGRSKADYAKESSREDVVSKLCIAVLFGCFGLELIEGWSIAELIWRGFQVVVFLATGSFKRTKSYRYVVEEFRGRLTKKSNLLHTFLYDMKGNEEIKEKEKNDVK